MNLFEEIEGFGGERLTSAVLRFLILRSQEFRENVIDLISRESVVGPVFLRESFSCRCEEATEDVNRGRGRLDIVIETDNAILGIENKLYAEFQPGQPEKYLERIRGLAKRQGKMSLLVLLVPDERVAEVKTKVKNTGDSNTYVVLSWQKVLDVQANNSNDMDATTNIAVEQLTGYIANKSSGVPIHYQLNHLKGSIKPTGIHWEFLEFLRSVLPNSLTEGTRIRTEKGSVGSYLNSKNWIWFGFVTPDSVQASTDGCPMLLLLADEPLSLPSDIFHPMGKLQMWREERNGWTVSYDDDKLWNSRVYWRSRLEPLAREVGKLSMPS